MGEAHTERGRDKAGKERVVEVMGQGKVNTQGGMNRQSGRKDGIEGWAEMGRRVT